MKDYCAQYDSFVKKHNPEFKESFEIFQEYIEKYVDSLKDQVILCQGGGNKSRADKYFDNTKEIIAIDIDKETLEINTYADKKILADVSSIPMVKDGSVDVVLSEWVLEHLNEPRSAFRETARVLKPGGIFIFETPNTANPIIGFFRLVKKISNKATKRISSKYLLDKTENDIYPAYYKANSSKSLDKMLAEVGFEKIFMGRTGCPGYFRSWKLLLWLNLKFEKLLELKLFDGYRAYLIGVYRKTA